MREYLREQLNKEMTRKQFLQAMAGLLLAVFGFHNLVNFLTSSTGSHTTSQHPPATDPDGFGSRRFGA
jgi:hypothetical protein